MLLRLCAALAAAVIFAQFSPAFAVGSVFAVPGIKVDATGATPTEACESARGQGHDLAWQRLIRRIVPRKAWGAVPQVGATDIDNFIAGFEVSGEKRSSTRCLAEMTYIFKADLVKEFLRKAGLPYADRQGPPALALPLFETAAGTRLWGDENLLLAAFKDGRFQHEMIPVIVPFGDAGDQAAVPPGMSMGDDFSVYRPIADKYGVVGVLVARGSVEGGTARIQASYVRDGASKSFQVLGAGGNEREALSNAIDELVLLLGEDWKIANAIDNSRQASVSVWAPYSSLGQWLALQDRLKKIQHVLELQISRVTATGASLVIRYRGRPDQFSEGLRDAGLGIYPSDGGLILTEYRPGAAMALYGGASDDDGAPEAPRAPAQPQVITPN